jgi:hypothetical protein
MDPNIKKELLHSFFQRDKWNLSRCLAPGMNCTAAAIQAHSLQNSQVLDLLVREGHVKSLTKRIDKKSGPVIFFDDVGRNTARTFAGFCAKHDSDIFKPIDTNIFCPANSEHLFLIAYRAVARELHAVINGASKIQSAYLKRVELGLDSGSEPSPAGMVAVEHMMKAGETLQYKERFDRVLVSKKHADVLHDVITIEQEEATIAVCALFSVENISRSDDCVRVALNVLPIHGKASLAVFSYLPEDAVLARSFLSGILTAQGYRQKHLLSRLILKNCENFVLSPAYYDKWSAEKKDAVIEYFVQTLYNGNLQVENENLYLF